MFVVSASSCTPEEEELVSLKEVASKLDRRTRPDGKKGEVAWKDPFSNDGLVEYRNTDESQWWELDDQHMEKGDRWNYGYDGRHYLSRLIFGSQPALMCDIDSNVMRNTW